jgi:hypothetical protein
MPVWDRGNSVEMFLPIKHIFLQLFAGTKHQHHECGDLLPAQRQRKGFSG